MKESTITGSGKEYYKYMNPNEYREKINTPAKNPEYFERFHKPIIERAKKKFGSPIHLIDIACGPADELDFIKDDPGVKIITTDISPDILSHVKNRLGPKALVFANDANHPSVRENIAEAGILLNAVIYNPDKMLTAMHEALRPGGQCAVNFRIFSLSQSVVSNLFSRTVGKTSTKNFTVETKGGVKTFSVRVTDFSQAIKQDGSPDLAMRQIGQQLYFKNIDDIRELIRMVGFKEVQHSKFEYIVPKGVDSSTDVTDVFILEKP